MRVVVVGAGGQLGSELCRRLGAGGVGLGHRDVDIADRSLVLSRLRELAPTAVINAAAYTAVDKAEDEPGICEAVNARGVENLADACRDLDCPLVQLSTDYIYGADRSRSVPYREEDQPGPLAVYGRTKLAGERRAAAWSKHLIVRTCGLYSRASPGNFVATMLRLARHQHALRVVNDQRCTPSYVPHVAGAVLHLLAAGAYGTYHVVNRGETSWYDFAREIFQRADLKVIVEPVSTAEFAARAPRPAYSVLDTGKYRALAGPELATWQEALAEYFS